MTITPLRSLTALALVALAAFACAHPSTGSKTMSTSDQTRAANKQKVETLFETCINKGELATLDALFSPEYVGPQGDKGPAGFRAVIVGLRSSFPDLHYTIDEALADGDKVAVRWHWTGTHQHPFRAYPATGKSVSNPGMAIFQFRDGKIVAAVLETDRLGFLQQIGAVPTDVGFASRPTPAATK